MSDELISAPQDNNESPWDDSASAAAITTTEAEWTRLSSGFQNAGYRDGITAGKENALQEGFDAGFAQAGAPRGRELGLLRGLASALHIHLSSHPTITATQQQQQQQEQSSREWEEAARTTAREIANTLATVRFSDIVTPLVPEEEAGHAHCVDTGGDSGHGEEEEREREDRSVIGPQGVGTIEDLRALRVQLETLLHQVGLQVDLNFE